MSETTGGRGTRRWAPIAVLAATGIALFVGVVKPVGFDVGSGTDIAAVKTAVAMAQTEFNTAQLLSPDRAIRTRQAQNYVNDVTVASARGVADFVSGTEVSAFRIEMVDVFDDSVVVDESTALAAQMLSDAQSSDIPSMVRTAFTTTAWQGVWVAGDTATARVVGSYTNCFDGGAFTVTDCETSADERWRLRLHRGPDGRWRLTERDGTGVE